MPDIEIVCLGIGVVGVIPVHKHAQTFGLVGLESGILIDSGQTGFGKIFQSKLFDIFFGVKTGFLFNLNFNPKSLAVKAILKSLFKALVVFVALEHIF